ncbi:MAG TPA: di-heme oxidoredictase family protein [Burkholderiales bacterium]|jgi:CxxC motif-containing protein (DUF1111 family)|nr:di-heme oxidoredictase family protein [Burkholderiales bacterium]
MVPSARHAAAATFVLATLLQTTGWLGAAVAPALPEAALSGGRLTIAEAGAGAYLQPAPLLDEAGRRLFAEGHKLFNTHWVFYWFEGGMWGRGPTSNADSCVACHQGNGRGTAQAPTDAARAATLECSGLPREIERDSLPQLACRRVEASPLSFIVRLSLPGETAHGGPRPHPEYGDQLQTFGVPRLLPAEGSVHIAWDERVASLADGEVVRLREPAVRISGAAYGPLGPDVMTSARVAPALVGMGLLDAVPDSTLLALAARAPAGGIRGKVNRVWDLAAQRPAIGRFGLKANHPNLRQQVAAAFIGDIGLSTTLFPEQNCPPVQTLCKEMMFAGSPEVTQQRLAAVTAYLRTLAVPARRGLDDPQVRRGEALFAGAGCAECHVPELRTGEFPEAPLLSNQVIHPYTDLLLHDMGEGLADHRPDYLAGGRDWRTAPLWGLGLSETVNGNATLLHDGRARNAVEAILWHGGEAADAREAFSALPREDRAALLAFLSSL